MEFSISANTLITALSRVIGLVNKTAISEYLSCVKLSIKDGQLLIEATNMDALSDTWINLEGSNSNGEICVDAHSLFSIVAKCPKNNLIDFSIDNTESTLKIFNIKCGKSKFDIATLDAEYFPDTLGTAEGLVVSIPKEELLFLIKKVEGCIFHNETRHNINGMLLDFKSGEGRIYGISTDCHRLAYAFVENKTITEDIKVTIPRKMVLELKKILESENGNVKMILSKEKVTFEFSSSRFTTKLIDAEFPDYNRVIPKDYTDYFSVNTKGFYNAIDLVSSIYSTSTFEKKVRLNILENAIKIGSTNDIHRSFHELSATFTKKYEMQIMCNALYIKEILQCFDSNEVKFFVKDSNFPMVAKDTENANFFYVIMPMKI
jgi:DNA polymerase-3 subunit beta